MTTDTEIKNRALRLLKAQRITSPGSKNDNVIDDVYDEVRDELLRGHTWHFGRKLAKLARSSTTPTFEFNYGYVLPSDWMRTVAVHDNDAGTGVVNFREGELAGVGVLLASVEDIYLEYVYKVTDPNRMSPDFRAAFSHELAVACPGISNLSAAAWDQLEKWATKRRNKAKSADALGSPPRQLPRGTWADSRQSWPSSRWPR
jgi:hypothetical protein